jgi:hypothetical protein
MDQRHPQCQRTLILQSIRDRGVNSIASLSPGSHFSWHFASGFSRLRAVNARVNLSEPAIATLPASHLPSRRAAIVCIEGLAQPRGNGYGNGCFARFTTASISVTTSLPPHRPNSIPLGAMALICDFSNLARREWSTHARVRKMKESPTFQRD